MSATTPIPFVALTVQRPFTHAHCPYLPGDQLGLPLDLAVARVLDGSATSPDLTRVRFTATTTIPEPDPNAGIHAASDQLFVFPAALAVQLVLDGSATTPSLTRVRFTASATIPEPSPYAGIYEVSDQLYVLPVDLAAQLIAAAKATVA